MPDPLNNIRVILVEPASPGNVGATARVLKTTGIQKLCLVNPGDWDNDESRRLAHGSGEILDRCHIFPDLASAVAECHFVVGTTHREGRYREVIADPDTVLADVVDRLHTQRIALVFGREKDGLWQEELMLCHLLLRFPSAVAYPSLNLSHAVLLFTYALYNATADPPPTPTGELATAGDREQMYSNITEALSTIEFTPYNDDPGHFNRVLRRFFNRVQLEIRDVRAIQTICGQIRKFSQRQRSA